MVLCVLRVCMHLVVFECVCYCVQTYELCMLCVCMCLLLCPYVSMYLYFSHMHLGMSATSKAAQNGSEISKIACKRSEIRGVCI